MSNYQGPRVSTDVDSAGVLPMVIISFIQYDNQYLV
jgi:hypothetical protein